MRQSWNMRILGLALLLMAGCQQSTIQKTNAAFREAYQDNIEMLTKRQQENYELLTKVDTLKNLHRSDSEWDEMMEKEANREKYIAYLEEHLLTSNAYVDESMLPDKYMYDIEARPNRYIEVAMRNTNGINTYVDKCPDGKCLNATEPLFYSTKNINDIQKTQGETRFDDIHIPTSEMSRQRHIMNKELLFANENEILQENLDFIMVKKERTAAVISAEEKQRREAEAKESGTLNKLKNFTTRGTDNVKNFLSKGKNS